MANENLAEQYWIERFEGRLSKYPDDHAKALFHSDKKSMDEIHQSVLEGLDIGQDMKILDVGCGLGDLSVRIHSQIDSNNLEIVHVDISERILQMAREYLTGKIGALVKSWEFVQMNLSDMAFADDFFDIVISSEALQYVDPYEGISELIRVTRNGGTVVVCFPNKRDPVIQKAEMRNKGRYQGVDIDCLVSSCEETNCASEISIKPLIFATGQGGQLYKSTTYRAISSLNTHEKQMANRFVVRIRL